MKSIVSIFAVLLSYTGYSQTHVIERNLELARLHQTTHAHNNQSSEFQLKSGVITSELLQQIASTMGQKDGYVEVSKTADNRISIKHESFLTTNDILDVLNQFGVTFTYISSLEIRL
jgi:hypothetical protein